MERLAIAVKCHDCNNPTRNPTGYCQHHGRNNRSARGIGEASGALTNVRLPEVQRLRQLNPASIERASEIGSLLVRRRPTVLVDPANNMALIRDAFATTDKVDRFHWEGDHRDMNDGEALKVGDLIFKRQGTGMILAVSPNAPEGSRAASQERLLEGAFDSARTVQDDRAARLNLTANSESYDDRAEILAQLRLGGVDPSALRYSSPREDRLIVSMKSATNPDVIERYELHRVRGMVDDGAAQEYGQRYRLVGEGELVSRRTKERVADTVPDAVRADRAELLDTIITAAETIDRHAVTVDGRLHLPLGWTDS